MISTGLTAFQIIITSFFTRVAQTYTLSMRHFEMAKIYNYEAAQIMQHT